MTDQLEQHRDAYRAVMAGIPGSVHVSHETVRSPAWAVVEIDMALPIPKGCPVCGDPPGVVGLTVKCRDWHNICRCGGRYGGPRVKGCLIRIWQMDGLRVPAHPKPEEEK